MHCLGKLIDKESLKRRLESRYIYTPPDFCFSHPKIQTCHQTIFPDKPRAFVESTLWLLYSGKFTHSRQRDYIMSLQDSDDVMSHYNGSDISTPSYNVDIACMAPSFSAWLTVLSKVQWNYPCTW